MIPDAAAAPSPSGGGPPPPNPALTAYQTWASQTPFVTRSVLSIQAVSYGVSWLYNPSYALANIPHFTLYKLELYRIVTSPLVNMSLINLMFAVWSFGEMGKRLEQSMGSTAFGWLCLSIGGLTNVLFVLVCCLLYLINNRETTYLFQSAGGIWIILFGMIAMECVQAPRGLKRRLFVVEVPVLYYPVVLLLFFALLGGGFSLAYILSMALGYALGSGRLEWAKLSATRAKQWEESVLLSFSRRGGWVAGSAASGSGAWSEEESAETSSGTATVSI